MMVPYPDKRTARLDRIARRILRQKCRDNTMAFKRMITLLPWRKAIPLALPSYKDGWKCEPWDVEGIEAERMYLKMANFFSK